MAWNFVINSPEAAVRRCFTKWVLLKIYKINRKTPALYFASFLIKLQRKRFCNRCFPVNFAKFLRTSILHRTHLGGCFCFWFSVQIYSVKITLFRVKTNKFFMSHIKYNRNWTILKSKNNRVKINNVYMDRIKYNRNWTI